MNGKLTISDISDMLSEKSGLSKKEAELFLKDLFQQAAEVISSGEPLTVNGIGRFKPVWVEPRGSVDVNTGEPIQIPGHYKISFTPDKSLRDAVNEPFASFTTEIISAGADKTEDVNITQENVSYDTTESISAEIVRENQESEQVMPNVEVIPVAIAESATSEGNYEKPEPFEAVPPVSAEVEPRQEVKEEQKSTYNEDDDAFDYYTQLEYKRRTRNGYIAGFFTALGIFLIIALGWYWVNRSKSSEYTLSFSPFKVTVGAHKTDTSKNKPDSTVVVKKELDKASDTSLKEPVVETIEPGKFLTTIAQKYYGNKIFWVYIYRENNKENKGKIWNPRDLPRGFKVIVPEASKYDIDANNPESVKKAQELERQILYEIQ